MTVAELIAALSEFLPDQRVLVRGYEYGLDDPLKPRALQVALNVNDEDYAGPHEAVDHGRVFGERERNLVTAVFIGCASRDIEDEV